MTSSVLKSLQVDGIRIRYGANDLFPCLSFEAHAGELIGILGPSGVGKSSLLRVIAGLQSPLSGQVLVSGRRVSDAAPAERRVAMLFQDPVIYDHLTVFDNIAFPLRCKHATRRTIDEEVRRIASSLGLDELLPAFPSRLSGGERQRVGLARAFVTDSDCALLDEPVKAAFEPTMRATIRRHIRKLHLNRGGVTLVVSHEQQETIEICDRLLFIFKDETYLLKPIEAVASPPDERVARFMAIGNVLVGSVDGTKLQIAGGLPFSIRNPDLLPPHRFGDQRVWYIPPTAISISLGTSAVASEMSWTTSGPVLKLKPSAMKSDQCVEVRAQAASCAVGDSIDVQLDATQVRLIG